MSVQTHTLPIAGPPSRRLEALSHFTLHWDIVMYALNRPAPPALESAAEDTNMEASAADLVASDAHATQDDTLDTQAVLSKMSGPASLGPFTRAQVCPGSGYRERTCIPGPAYVHGRTSKGRCGLSASLGQEMVIQCDGCQGPNSRLLID